MPSTPTHKLPAVQAILRIAIYAATAICSFVIFGPLTRSLVKQNGYCLLYAKVRTEYSLPSSACNYNIATAVIVCLLWPIVAIIFLILSITGKIKISLTSTLPSLILAITDGIALILVLVSACTITVGLKTLCDSFRALHPQTECSNVFLRNTDTTDRDYFYGTLITAQIAAWVAFMMWLVQLGSNLARFWLYRRNSKNRRNRRNSEKETTGEVI